MKTLAIGSLLFGAVAFAMFAIITLFMASALNTQAQVYDPFGVGTTTGTATSTATTTAPGVGTTTPGTPDTGTSTTTATSTTPGTGAGFTPGLPETGGGAAAN